jgi:DNA replication protein DnaC
MSEPTLIRDALAVPTLIRSAKARETFAASFTCPDPTGVTAPCDGGEYDDQPVIPWGDDSQWRIVCPAFASIKCGVFEKIQARRRARERDEWIEAGRARGIPVRFTDATFETAQPTAAVVAMRAYLEEDAKEGRWLVLLGPPGTSKTWSAACAVRQARRRARLVQVDRFVGELMNWDARAAAIEDAVSVPLLVLDDYGRGYMKPDGFAELGLEELLSARHAEMLPTVITSNWTVAVMKRRLSERLVDRIRECAKVVALAGPSLRG